MKDFEMSRDIRRKVRGAPRKSRQMVAHLADIPNEGPVEPLTPEDGCWHTHLPVAADFIDSQKTPRWVQRLCMQTLLDTAERIRADQRAHGIPCRVVVMLTLPGLWSAQILVFFGSEYYSIFFDRNTPDQTWTPKPPRRSLARDWALRVPEGFLERGYDEANLRDDGKYFRGELWFYGELGPEV